MIVSAETRLLKLGLPKGSLQDATLELFRKAGYTFSIGDRQYHARCDDPEIRGTLVRSQEMARYVEDGHFDCGLCGLDWVRENQSDVHIITDLIYSKVSRRKVRWVLAAHKDSPIFKAEDLRGKTVATEAVGLTAQYFRGKGMTPITPADRRRPDATKGEVLVEFSWGATEVKVPDLVDAIVEVTETGSSLRANNLEIIDTVMESNTVFIANKDAWADEFKQRKMEAIAMMLKASIDAEGRVGLKMNVRKADLENIKDSLPSITSPTVSQLSNPDWVAVEIVLHEKDVRDLIPQLKVIGAEGIIEYPLNKIVD
ncbi:MAG: ATP phosphoribosyltransferase [Sumerlaeia bacterium]